MKKKKNKTNFKVNLSAVPHPCPAQWFIPFYSSWNYKENQNCGKRSQNWAEFG